MIDQKLSEGLKKRAQEGDAGVLRSAELRSLFDQLKTLPAEERGAFGQAVNALRQELTELLISIKTRTRLCRRLISRRRLTSI